MSDGYLYEFKDQSPIRFEFFQSDMEKIMYQLNQIIDGNGDIGQLQNIRDDLQHKIDIHIERGEWFVE